MKVSENIKYQLRIVAPFAAVMIFLFITGIRTSLFERWAFASILFAMYSVAFSFFYAYVIAPLLPEFDSGMSHRSFRSVIAYYAGSRFFPFIMVYLTAVMTSIVLYQTVPGWPHGAVVCYLDDRAGNIVLYFLLFLCVCQLGWRQLWVVPLFAAAVYLIYLSDNLFYETIFAVSSIYYFRIIRTSLALYLLLWIPRKPVTPFIINMVVALTLSFVINHSLLFMYEKAFLETDNNRIKIEYGIRLAQLGKTDYLDELSVIIFDDALIDDLGRVYAYFQHYRMPVTAVKNDEWNNVLYSGDIEMANEISLYMIKEGIKTDPHTMLAYVRENAQKEKSQLEKYGNLVRLTADSIEDSDDLKMLLDEAEESSKSYLIWVIQLLGEAGGCAEIDRLIEYLPVYDQDVSYAAYSSLVMLTGIRPDRKEGVYHNSTASMRLFKEYFVENCIDQ